MYPEPLMTDFLVVGIDLSLSRTGYSISLIRKNSNIQEIIKIGSFKPERSSDPIWIRSTLIGISLLKEIEKALSTIDITPNIILSMETPTPMNDFLTSLNRVVTSVLFSENSILHRYSVNTLSVNASTLRSAMNLTQRGAGNKKENIEKAYSFVSSIEYPGVDSDSCDGILLTQMGIYASLILNGQFQDVPDNIIKILCEDREIIKGKGRNQKISTKGLFHNPLYWFSYTKSEYSVIVKDARIPPKKRLLKVSYTV